MGSVIEAYMHSDSQGCIEYRHRHGFVSVTVVVQPKSCRTDIYMSTYLYYEFCYSIINDILSAANFCRGVLVFISKCCKFTS